MVVHETLTIVVVVSVVVHETLTIVVVCVVVHERSL